jgi:hypothetical protein
MRLRARVGLARRGLAVGASLRGEPKGFAVSGGVHAGTAARSRTAGAATGGQRSKGDSRRAEEGEGEGKATGSMASRAGGWQHHILGALVGLRRIGTSPASTHAALSTRPPSAPARNRRTGAICVSLCIILFVAARL